MPEDARARRSTFRLDGQRLLDEREARDTTDADGKKRKFTQIEMAEYLGIGLSAYQKAEKGECVDARIAERIKYKLDLDDTQLAVTPCSPEPAPSADPRIYLRQLHEECRSIRVVGLLVEGKVPTIGIEKVYIDLRAVGRGGEDEQTGKGEKGRLGVAEDARPAEDLPRLFEEIRKGSQLKWVVIGGPGTGKSTLLKRIAFDQSYPEKKNQKFPVLIRIAELEDYIGERVRDRSGNLKAESPEWIPRFLEDRGNKAISPWELDAGFFREKLRDAATLILLDGLDEVGSAERRSAISELFTEAARTWRDASFVVTRRPLPETEKLLEDFSAVRVGELDDQAQEKFLGDWLSQATHAADAQSQKEALLLALRRRPEIRRMARNPLMLTSLAVVHVNMRRQLPEARVELYKEILGWLSVAREQSRRPHGNTLLDVYSALALGMHSRRGGSTEPIEKTEAAAIVASEFLNVPAGDREAAALEFLEREPTDSGIIVDRGSTITYWHPTFEEYFAARACAGFENPAGELIESGRWIRPEWREVMLLVPGVLLDGGRRRVDSFFNAVLARAEDAATPRADRARAAGLVGSAVRDLKPFGYVLPDESRYKRLLEEALNASDLRVRVEAAEALGQAGDPRLKENNWVTIRGGTFLMGAQKTRKGKPGYDEDAYDDEGPPREVTLKESFQIGRYPVTVEEFQPFVEDEDDGYRSRRYWTTGGYRGENAPPGWEEQTLFPNRPVVNVDWYAASAYCLWATAQLPERSEWKIVRLPTEEEFEFVARGPEGRRYPWGDAPPEPARANYDETGVGKVAPVGLFPAGNTPDGVADMAGNVWEWTSSKYDKEGNFRVLRGASFSSNGRDLRAAFRGRVGPGVRDVSVGFRCVRE